MFDASAVLELAHQTLRQEADAILKLDQRLGDDFIRACQLLLKCHDRIIVTGMGKPGHIARKLAATLASTGTPAFFLHPGEASHGDIGAMTKRDVVIAISKSGNTAEMLAIIPTVKLLGIPLITITGNPNSQLAQAADVNLDASVEREACPLGLAPTSSTTVALALGDAIAVALLHCRGFTDRDFAKSHPGGTLGKRLLLRVQDIMRSGNDIPKVQENTLVADALMEMTQKGLGMTTIVTPQNILRGIFTDGDLRRVLDKKIDISSVQIVNVMTEQCLTIDADCLAIEAVKKMEQYHITALVVVNHAQKIQGVVHMHDLLKSGLI